MLKPVLFATALIAGLSLTGCANSPQVLRLQPAITAQLTPVGQGQAVSVRVVDGRSSPVLGSRGGLYAETSTVSVDSQDLVARLQGQAETAVRLLGFTPGAGAYGAPQLVLTVESLKYQTPQGSYVTEASINTTLRADVQNSARRYSGRYSANLNQRFGMAPNEETNVKLISDVVSDALNRTFKDPEVSNILSGR